ESDPRADEGDPLLDRRNSAGAERQSEFATTRVPVALNDAKAVCPTLRPSRRSDSAVISALTGPIETRTRLPSSVILRIGAQIRFMAESFGGTTEMVMSHG